MEWQGLKIHNLYEIKKVLEEWILVNQNIYDSWEGDIPWRYGERTALSVFSGAIWRLGGVVLEEFSTQKSGTKKGWGRSDLYIELEDFKSEIEAKHVYANLNNSRVNKVISQKINEAVCDIGRNKKYDSRHRIGLVHVTPTISYDVLSKKKLILNNWIQYLQNWINKIIEISYDACAWYFPESMPFTRFVDSKRSDQFMPGSIILLKENNS
jgi:hypothetical protein